MKMRTITTSMSNSKLLKEVKKSNPNSYIIYKSHPDVNCGNRKGYLSDQYLDKFCHLSLKNVNISYLISSQKKKMS